MYTYTNPLPSHSTNTIESTKPLSSSTQFVDYDYKCHKANNVGNLVEQVQPKTKIESWITLIPTETIKAPDGPLYIIAKGLMAFILAVFLLILLAW